MRPVHLVSVEVAARMARVPVRTIYNWRKSGKIGRYGRFVDWADVCDEMNQDRQRWRQTCAG